MDPHCPVGRALDLIGERWSILILRDLFVFGPRKFSDFQRTLPDIAPATLSTRLKSLETSRVIERRSYCDHPPRFEYALSETGRALGPAIKELRAWGEKYA